MLASVVSNPVVASSESEMCSEELGSSEMEKQCAFVGLLYVSVCVGREEQPEWRLVLGKDGRVGQFVWRKSTISRRVESSRETDRD